MVDSGSPSSKSSPLQHPGESLAERAEARAAGAGKPSGEKLALVGKAREILLSKKGQDVVTLDVRELSDVTDFFVIATGTSAPHIKALAQEVEHVLKKEGIRCYRHAGAPESGWIVVDYLDMVIHIFSPDTRDYYALEQLWSDAPRIES